MIDILDSIYTIGYEDGESLVILKGIVFDISKAVYGGHYYGVSFYIRDLPSNIIGKMERKPDDLSDVPLIYHAPHEYEKNWLSLSILIEDIHNESYFQRSIDDAHRRLESIIDVLKENDDLEVNNNLLER